MYFGQYEYLYSPIIRAQHTILQHYTYKKHKKTRTHTQLKKTNRDLKCQYTTPARENDLAVWPSADTSHFSVQYITTTTTTTHTFSGPFFRDYTGEPVPER